MQSHVDPEREQFEAFKGLARDEPVAMLNLIRFREAALYPADHPLAGEACSGAQAYRRYSAASRSVFQRIGGTIVWAATPELVLIGPPDERWDAAFVARYPSAAAFLEMIADPAYREAVAHRRAAVATSRLIRTRPAEAGASLAQAEPGAR